MKLPKWLRSQTGSGIIEVIIATLVVSLVLTAVAATLTVSVKNTAQSRYQEVARSRAQAGLEVFRRERNTLGWQSFRSALGTGTYCLNNLPANSSAFTTMSSSQCSTGVSLIGTEFRRNAVVTVVNPNEVKVDLAVTWIDGSLNKEVKLTQIFRKYAGE